MSLAYCEWCECVVEGNTEIKSPDYGDDFEACKDCGEEVSNLSEDDPKEER